MKKKTIKAALIFMVFGRKKKYKNKIKENKLKRGEKNTTQKNSVFRCLIGKFRLEAT